MHVLQPKHHKIKAEDAKALLARLNISIGQLPRIKKSDSTLPLDAKIGDIIKIERRGDKGKTIYYRVVVPD